MTHARRVTKSGKEYNTGGRMRNAFEGLQIYDELTAQFLAEVRRLEGYDAGEEQGASGQPKRRGPLLPKQRAAVPQPSGSELALRGRRNSASCALLSQQLALQCERFEIPHVRWHAAPPTGRFLALVREQGAELCVIQHARDDRFALHSCFGVRGWSRGRLGPPMGRQRTPTD